MKATIISLLAMATLSGPALANAAVVQSATGSGMLFIQTATASGSRTFTFTAQNRDDGTTIGEMQLVNRFNGRIVHARLDCLNVVGNTATMSGVVTYANDPIFETFSAVVFTVVDNGEGANAPPDAISFAFFDLPSPAFTCMTSFFPPDQTIVGGNVQVRG